MRQESPESGSIARVMAESVARRAVDGDLEALWPLIQAFYEIDHHDFERDRIERAIRPLLVDDTYGQVWVLDRAGEVEGYAVVTWSWSVESGGRDCILDEIYVAFRARGRGSKLLSAVFDGARAAGASAVFLETEAHNVRGRSFYQRHGFDVEGCVWMSRSLLG